MKANLRTEVEAHPLHVIELSHNHVKVYLILR